MTINPIHQTGCQISLDEANSRKEAILKGKDNFEVFERSITWTLKAILRQGALKSLQ